MSRVLMCDRCGKIVKEKDERCFLRSSDGFGQEDFDLCKECADELRKWLKGETFDHKMTLEEYYALKMEMCQSNDDGCATCPLHIGIDAYRCEDCESAAPRKAVEIVTKWKKEQGGK